MSKGRLIAPNLDDRTWNDLVTDAKALIPKYTPEWTDQNPSDLGITLIELFAWIAEQIIYRLNRVPEKNFIKFLDLIGVVQDPPTPAQTDITFKIAGDEVVAIPQGIQVSTPPSGTEEGIIFETDRQLNAVNLMACIFMDTLSNRYWNLSAKVLEEPYESVALPIEGKNPGILMWGIRHSTKAKLSIGFRVPEGNPELIPKWVYSRSNDLNHWGKAKVSHPDYHLQTSALIDATVQGTWRAGKPGDWGVQPRPGETEVKEPYYWMGVWLSNVASGKAVAKIDRLAANQIPATNALSICEASLGHSNGGNYQVFKLRHNPLYVQPNTVDPYQHLVIAVKEPNQPWVNWKRVDNFSSGNVNEYRCNTITGEISFGNYPTGDQQKPGFGRIPPEGSEIKAARYRYVAGGMGGNVPVGTIVVQRNPVNGVVSVTNEQPAAGGTDWEKFEDTLIRGPQTLQIRERAVTAEDYENLARRATTDVYQAHCFPPKKRTADTWVTEPFDRSPGRVNLIIIPNDRESRKPLPGAEVIERVKSYLDQRRTITSVLIEPMSPFYVEIIVAIKIYTTPGQNAEVIRQAIQQKLYGFLHPVAGGPEGQGWDIGQDLYVPDVFQVIESVPEINYIDELKIGPLGSPPPSDVRLKIKEYQLICASPLSDANYAIEVIPEELEG